MNVPCEVCGKSFYKNYDYRKTCSRKCAADRLGSREERFWSKVDKNGPTMPHMSTCCWVWTSECVNKGYGRMKYGTVRQLAHRISWELKNGPIPKDLQVLHQCDKPPCVRPDHLFLGTQKENLQDMLKKGRANKAIGQRHGRSKITEADVRKAHYLVADGVPQMEVALKLGVHVNTIARVISGSRWAHIYAEFHGKAFLVTDPALDAPDGAVVDGFKRVGEWWHPVDRR